MLNPKVDSPPFAATATVAAPRQHYQVDPVHQPLDLHGPFRPPKVHFSL